MTIEPPSACSIFVEIDAEWKAGMTSTLAVSESRQNGYCAISSRLSATSAAISPSYSKSTRRWSRMRTASMTLAERSPGGWPKVEKASMRDARLVAQPARDARRLDRRSRRVSAAVGISVMAVSATITVRPRARTSETPISWWPGFGSMTLRTSPSAMEKLRVTPVTIASASPSATIAAPKWLRSWLIMRWQSRNRIALPLQPLIEILRIGRVAGDSAALWISIPSRPSRSRPASAAVCVMRSSRPTRIGRAEPLVTKDMAARMTCSSSPSANTTRFGIAAHALDGALQRAGDGIAPRGELGAVGVHVDDGLRATPEVHGGLRDSGRNHVDQARIERHRDDVFAPEAGPRALVGGGDVVGHVLLRELGQSLGGGDLHLHVDRRGPHVERAAEDVGEAEDVVDLVRIVRPAGRDDHVVADGVRLLGRDFRVRIRHGEDDRVRRPCS